MGLFENFTEACSKAIGNIANSPVTKALALKIAEDTFNPILEKHGQGFCTQMDPEAHAFQIDYFNVRTGHTTIRHQMIDRIGVKPVQLQPVSILVERVNAAYQMNNAANAATQATTDAQQNQNNQ